MGDVIKFRQRVETKKEEENRERQEPKEPAIRSVPVITVVERIIQAIDKNLLENESIETDLDALADIFKMFSVREPKMIGLLSGARESGLIERHDMLLLFAIFMAYKEENSEEIIENVLGGFVKEKTFDRVGPVVGSYLKQMAQKTKK